MIEPQYQSELAYPLIDEGEDAGPLLVVIVIALVVGAALVDGAARAAWSMLRRFGGT